MIVYATLTQLRERLNIPAADTTNDGRLLVALRQATAQLNRATTRRYAPTVQTRRVDYQEPRLLRLELDLLELTGITNGDGTTFTPDDVYQMPEGDGIKFGLILKPESGSFAYSITPVKAIQVSGIWGTHDAWSAAWRDSTDTVQSTITAADTTISVADADGADAAHLSPRFQVGQLIRAGEEYMHVTGVNPTTDTLTVIRGVRGTTAAEHITGAGIDVYQPPQEIQALCLRWATWLYQQVDAGIGAGADWLYPPDLPPDILRQVEMLRRVRVA